MIHLYSILGEIPVNPALVLIIIFLVFVLVAFFKTIRIVPQREAYIVERLGKYSKTLEAGFHILVPFVDKVSY